MDTNICKLLGEDYRGHCVNITMMRGEMTEVLDRINGLRTITSLLAHEETGHGVSYQRDIRVRKYCKERRISFKEFPQMGVTRGLKSRDGFSKKYNEFMGRRQCERVSGDVFGRFLVRDLGGCGVLGAGALDGRFGEDRRDRQKGGESKAVRVYEPFLSKRGEGFSRGISSPLSAWSSCSRLSAYLSFGHVSLRFVVQSLGKKQEELRRKRKELEGKGVKDGWLKSLAAFHSRLRWRSHFIQKLESEPEIEFRAQHVAYDKLRTEPWDFNQDYYNAWASGSTGFPMADACMRCLLQHGWVNFRMRAMLVSFACYNLWLDWRKIDSHLARCFLDFEPGIHYPQLQMQCGSSGINAMRVYNVTKQGKDQDRQGIFIKRYVPELSNVPLKYIHEPHKMPNEVQAACGVIIDTTVAQVTSFGSNGVSYYPSPIVDEKASAKVAKDRIAAVRRLATTKALAQQVYIKHGSRKGGSSRRNSATKNERPSGVTEIMDTESGGGSPVLGKRRRDASRKSSTTKKRKQVSPHNSIVRYLKKGTEAKH